MTSAVNCRPLKEPPCFTATVRHRLAMGGFYLAVAAPKSCNRAWHLDEVAIKIAGVQHWLWRAVDQNGMVLDVLVQSRRDKRAAERLLRKLLKRQCQAPRV